MTVVIGTAGHIDHGKTTLLRALTGIDADRLPEEKARGMTIDVGYAHLTLPDGDVLDFVDVPGHDRLVGNMLVGAGEIDAAMLVVAADDGPRAQTIEHLALLDALAIVHGIVVITKTDLVDEQDRRRIGVREAVEALLAGTSLASAPIIEVSATTGQGLDGLREALVDLRDAVAPEVAAREGPARLAIDRVFTIRGHGAVVTGSLRGGAFERGQAVRIEPGGLRARIREIQARNRPIDVATGGRTALNLAGLEPATLHRGMVVVAADDPDLATTDRVLVALRPPAPRAGLTARLHLGTAEAGAEIGRGRRERIEVADGGVTGIVRLDRPVAALAGDRFVLRAGPAGEAIGGRVLDADPPRGPSRRRLTDARAAALAAAETRIERAAARLDLHGAVVDVDGRARLASDLEAAIDAAAVAAVTAHHASRPDSAGLSLADVRPLLGRPLRRSVAIDARSASRAIDERLDRLVAAGTLARDGDRLRDPARPSGVPPAVLAAMDRLEAALGSNGPPSLADATRATGCPPEGVRALERSGRIVRLEPDLAYASVTFARLEDLAVSMARERPLTPAAYRDATGTSRRYVMTLLEEFGRRGVLVRTDVGHVPGPRAPAR
jgi:selenocysteine-specific elongation factor